MRTATFLLASSLFLAACGDDASSSGGGNGATATGAGQGGGTLTTGSASTACERGLVECGGECVDVYTDPLNCGACGKACDADRACHHRQCTEPLDCSAPDDLELCRGVALCDRSAYESIDDCGSCGNACDDDAFCQSASCAARGGDGTSCASPFILLDDDRMQFWFDGSEETHLFPCGPLEPRPTRWFRWTAEDDDLRIEIDGNPGTDDLVVEIFDAAACDEAASLGCNEDGQGTLPELELTTAPGATYFIAVGASSETPPLGRFAIRMDD